MQKIVVEGLEISVIRKRIKNIHLKVLSPDGRVVISAPTLVSLKRLTEFASSRIDWIRKNQKKIKDMNPHALPLYINDEKHSLFGEQYILNIIENAGRDHIKLKENRIELYHKKEADSDRSRLLMERWYKARLEELLPDIIQKWQPVIGVKVGEFVVRKMKSRWGSCNTGKSKITINLELARRPVYLLEYVMVHEMTHLLERGHNQRFYGFMTQWIPEWKEYRKELRGGIC